MGKKRVLVGYGVDVDAVAGCGLHGYTHEHISGLSASQQRDVLQKSIEVITSFTGKKPQGYTAPAWDTSKELIPLLEEFGIIYDHSFMHHDLQPYFAPDSSHQWVETDLAREAATWMSPMTKLKPSKIVEIPANWHVDDCKLTFERGKIDVVDTMQGRLYSRCLEELGRPPLMYFSIINYINKHEGVEWMSFGDMAKEFLEGRIAGVEIEGGAET
ncbi:hypothetical protein E4T39_08090 [Aureobasidium subglaciale]|nr:hypothetical protein E4T39_08090 [Aureobasidium subglaciale]